MSYDAKGYRVAESWSGSEGQRPEQLGCKPPTTVPESSLGVFVLPAGSSVQIKRVAQDDHHWRPYTTQKPIGFARYEHNDHRGRLIFRHEGWHLRVTNAQISDCHHQPNRVSGSQG